MIVYTPGARPIIKACLYSFLTGEPCHLKSSENLFAEQDKDAESLSLEFLQEEYSRRKGEGDWFEEGKMRLLHVRTAYALRHSSPQKYAIIEKALLQAFEYGLEYCLGGISRESRHFNTLARDVSHEVYRMLGFIRFSVLNEDTLVASPKLSHDTADLILKKFRSRYPHYRLVLVLQHTALIFSEGHLTEAPPQVYRQFLMEKDHYAGIWEEYYLSQYIESRQNIRLAQKAIPRKYWDWMIEGKTLQKVKDSGTRQHSDKLS